MEISLFSRLMHFEYLEDDMLKGSIFYGKRKKYGNLKKFLTERPVYRTGKILSKEFAAQGLEQDWQEFMKWANQPISEEDRLYSSIQYFERFYNTFDNYHFMLTNKNACDLYIKTQLQKAPQVDLSKVSQEDILNSMKE